MRRLLSRGAFVLVLVLVTSACSGDRETRVPPVSDLTFGFVAIGDFGTGAEDEVEISQDVEDWTKSNPVDAIVTTGDNFYPKGSPEYFDRAWTKPYGWVSDRGLDVFPSLGNHDFDAEEGKEVMDFFDMPGPYYKTGLGDADIFVLNSNRVDDPAQLEWLEEALTASDRAWQIAVFHHPAYSCSEHDGSSDVIEEWVPLFEEFGVDLVLTGHDHNYQRFAPENGVTYLVTAGAGADLYELDRCEGDEPSRVAANDDLNHFVAVSGSAKRLEVQAIAEDGSVIDEFSLEAGG